MNLKNNELMVIGMLLDYLIGDLVFVANETMVNDVVLKCMHAIASYLKKYIYVMNFS